MNYLLISTASTCPDELVSIMAIVRFIVNAICIVIPIVLIVLIILDLAKIVTAGNLDDKIKKEVTSKVVARVAYALIIFLVPTIVKLIFGLIPLPDKAQTKSGNMKDGATWRTCWDAAADKGVVL